MARRPSTDSEDSQKENVEPAQVRQERMAKAQSESRSAGKRRVVDEGDDEDEQMPHVVSDAEAERGTTDNDEDEADGDASPRSKKRARVNEEGDAVDVDADAEPRPSFKARKVKLERDEDGFVPGSIVRIKLHKFLTYDDAEFRTSSHLNMILGPNGTGKSSIACAICLGLNQSPSLLGRAKEPAQYIKSGNNEGSIELELKGPIGKSNVIIRRIITKLDSDEKSKKQDRSKSSFFLNDESVTQRAVNEAVSSLGVRCGNLCTFLPQDRVAEFAKMTPKELLKATQEAAGDERLTEWHSRLITDGKELKEMAGNMASEEEHLQNLEARNAALQKDVERYKERRDIERELELLDLVLPFKEYVESKDRYALLKVDRQKAHDRALALQVKNKPFNDFKDSLEEQHKACGEERDRLKDQASRGFDKMNRKCTESENLEQDAEEANRKLDTLKEQEKLRRDRINNLTRAIEKAQHDLDNPPETEDLAPIEDELKSNADMLRSLNRDKGVLEDEMKTLIDERERQRVICNRAKQELDNLDNVSHRKLEGLGTFDKDTAEAVVWLRRNRNRFRMEVIEPAILSLSVPESRFAASIEACFSFAQLRSFVTQCKEDYTLMNRLFNDSTEALNRKCHIAVWYRHKMENQLLPPPLSPEELLREGFLKYAMDCVVYPDGMQWFLTREINLHRTAIALDPSRVDVKRATDMVSRIDASGQGGSASFIVGKVMHSVQRSRYGKRLPVTITKDVRDARNLKHPPVDQERKTELQRQVADAQRNVDDSERQSNTLQEKLGASESSIKEVNDAKKAIQDRKQRVNDVQRQLHALELKISNYERQLATAQQAPSADDERQRLRKQIFDVAKKRVAIANELCEIAKGIIASMTKSTQAGLQHLQIGANKKALDDLCKERGDAYARARLHYEQVNNDYIAKRAETKKLLDKSKAKLHEVDDEIRTTFEQMEQRGDIHGKTSDDFKLQQENLRARLELLTITNPGVIEQYKAREVEIAKFKDKLEKRAIKKGDLERRIKKTRDKWYPSLQELIEVIGTKFSEAFDSVGCAGEIRIAEQEDDYENWAIEILVKFRDNERLQLLTGTRQSGGERALTTIMFLMSLTQMARSPFSLVDEINQGMDARYERAVHNSLVDVTCREDSGQYFLITPKLLTDLEYHKRMKVLCVTNGEWLPELLEDRSGDMRQMVENYVRNHRQA